MAAFRKSLQRLIDQMEDCFSGCSRKFRRNNRVAPDPAAARRDAERAQLRLEGYSGEAKRQNKCTQDMIKDLNIGRCFSSLHLVLPPLQNQFRCIMHDIEVMPIYEPRREKKGPLTFCLLTSLTINIKLFSYSIANFDLLEVL